MLCVAVVGSKKFVKSGTVTGVGGLQKAVARAWALMRKKGFSKQPKKDQFFG